MLTAIHRDEEFAAAFRRDFVGPKAALTDAIFERARGRGEIGPDVDLSILGPALAGIVLHRMLLMGHQPTPDLVADVVDQIILPAATRGARPAPTLHTPEDPA